MHVRERVPWNSLQKAKNGEGKDKKNDVEPF